MAEHRGPGGCVPWEEHQEYVKAVEHLGREFALMWDERNRTEGANAALRKENHRLRGCMSRAANKLLLPEPEPRSVAEFLERACSPALDPVRAENQRLRAEVERLRREGEAQQYEGRR